MIHLIEVVPPRKDIPLQQFHDHWRHPHGVIAKMIPSIQSYVQHHRFDTPLVASDTPYEGCTIVRFDDDADFGGIQADPLIQNDAQPDEERFCDRPNMKLLLAEEEVLAAPASTVPAHFPARYDSLWSATSNNAISILQFVEAGEWIGDDDADLSARIGALHHVRYRPAMPDAPYVGLRELLWPTLTCFERGMKADPKAWAMLRDRPASAFCLVGHAERMI